MDNVRKLELEVENTTQSITEQIDLIEEKALSKLEDIKDSFNLKKQVVKHPTPMVGGAVVTGLVLGAVAATRSRRVRPLHREPLPTTNVGRNRGVWDHLFEEFRSEIDMGKKVLLGVALNKASTSLGRAMPQWSALINDIFHGASSRLANNRRPI